MRESVTHKEYNWKNKRYISVSYICDEDNATLYFLKILSYIDTSIDNLIKLL